MPLTSPVRRLHTTYLHHFSSAGVSAYAVSFFFLPVVIFYVLVRWEMRTLVASTSTPFRINFPPHGIIVRSRVSVCACVSINQITTGAFSGVSTRAISIALGTRTHRRAQATTVSGKTTIECLMVRQSCLLSVMKQPMTHGKASVKSLIAPAKLVTVCWHPAKTPFKVLSFSRLVKLPEKTAYARDPCACFIACFCFCVATYAPINFDVPTGAEKVSFSSPRICNFRFAKFWYLVFNIYYLPPYCATCTPPLSSGSRIICSY